MTETSYVVGVILLAVFVGAALPVLFQLLMTLRSARRFLDGRAERLDRALEQTTAAATRIEKIGGLAEEHIKGLKPAVDAVSDLGRSMNQMRDSLRTTVSPGP